MTIQEVIAKVDDLMPNQYTREQKIGWLSTLDGKIYHEVISTHEGGGIWAPIFESYDDEDCELLVQPPYAPDLYVYYLESRIAAENNEMAKYAQYAALFNTAFQDYSGWYNRTHMPVQRARWRM